MKMHKSLKSEFFKPQIMLKIVISIDNEWILTLMVS